MLIVNDRIVIAHMKKCGGTSVCKGMIESLPPETIDYWGYTAEGEEKSALSRRRGKVWKHSPVADILQKLSRKREETQIYLVSVRPWWDRVGSFYFHAKRYNRMSGEKYPWVTDMTLSEFIRSKYMADVERLDRFCSDADGNLLVDHFVDYTRIAEWYREFMASLGVAAAALPTYNQGRKKFAEGYDSLFNAEDIDYLRQEFAGEDALLKRFRPAPGGLLSLN